MLADFLANLAGYVNLGEVERVLVPRLELIRQAPNDIVAVNSHKRITQDLIHSVDISSVSPERVVNGSER